MKLSPLYQKQLAKLSSSFYAGLYPGVNLNLTDWCEKYISLPTSVSATPGKWKAIPYQVGIMEAINDPTIEKIVFKKSTRVGYTQIISNAIGYHIHNDPCNMIVVQPTLDDARGYSKDQFESLVTENDVLNGLVAEAKSRSGKNTMLRKTYPGGNLYIIGANSPRGFRRIFARIIIFDEIDGYAAEAGSEGNQIQLGIRRTDTSWNRKIILGSTPTIKGDSRIDDAFSESDQRYYYVPCPHCKQMQTLKWGGKESVGGIKWPKGEPTKAYYQCESCTKPIDHGFKEWMVENGEWRATKPYNGVAGFAIWAAYAYSPGAAWGKLAEEWIACKGDPLKVRSFVNTILGEAHEERGDAPSHELLWLRREHYKRNVVPRGGLVLIASADVQVNRIEVEVQAFGRNMECWSIDSRIIWGDPKVESTWVELAKLYDEVFPSEAGYPLKVKLLAVDTGAFTTHVYNFCRQQGPTRAMAVKGRNGISVISRPSLIDFDWQGKTIKNGVQLWHVGINIIKSELYQLLKINIKDGDPIPYGYKHYPDYDQDYFKQLTSESLRRVNGKWIWSLPPGQSNEKLDLNVYCRAAAEHLRLPHFQDTHWSALEADLEQLKVINPIQPSQFAPRRKTGNVYKGIQREF